MRIAYFDCCSGASGDMWVGALLDAGLDLLALQEVIAALQLDGVGVRSERVLRAGVAGTRFVVEMYGAPAERAHGERAAQGAAKGPKLRPMPKGPVLPTASGHAHAHRRLSDLLEIVRRARLPAEVERRSAAVFAAIAEVEAKAHDMSVEDVHFHEVGAEDTIVDVVAACMGMHLLGVERVYASAVETGSGVVRAAHGILPVPAPATMALLRGVPLRQQGLQGERTTPTGAALLREYVAEFEPRLCWVPRQSGYGAGTKDDPSMPNLLRVTLGEQDARGAHGMVEEISCNLDTATGEQLGRLLEEALERGALDAFVQPILMKKGRPGHLFTALVEPGEADALAAWLLEDSGSLGVRRRRTERTALERWQERRSTPLGEALFKCVRLPSGAVQARIEDDELKRLCRERGLSSAAALRRILGS